LSAIQPKFAPVAETSQAEQKGHSSVFEFIVPADVPVDRIAFSPGVSPAMFSRSVSVSAVQIQESKSADPVQPARTFAFNGSLLRLHSAQNGHRIDEERLEIDVPWMEFRTPAKWTITIENGDDAPLRLDSVRLQMLERSLCFEASANARHTLYYGDPSLSAPRYDYAELFTTLVNAQVNATRIEAGPEELNPIYQPRPDGRPFTEKHPALLWAALLAVIATLGAIALRSTQRTARTPK
jgi:hypothetical protein